jgi:hypothetical protein
MNKNSVTIPVFIVLAGLLLFMTSLSNNNVFAAQTNKPNSNSLKGAISSIQNDQNGRPAWVVSGVFKIYNYSITSKTTTSPILNATFHMNTLNGASLHTHTISDFKTTGTHQTFGNTTTINGTSTVTMKEGPVKDVPTTINIFDKSAISIWLDPSKIMKHFGNTPIFGYPCDTCGG